MCCSPAATRSGTRRSSPTAGSTRCSSGPSPTSGRSPMPPPSASPTSRTAWRRSCGAIWSPSPTCPSGSGRGRALSGTSPGQDVPVVLDPTLLLEQNGLGGRGQGRRRGPGLYPLLLHQPPRRPGTLYPPPGGGDGAAGGAAVRRTPEGPPQGPLRARTPVRRSFWVCSRMPPMCAPTPSTERCSPSSSKSPSSPRWHPQRWRRRRAPGPSAC